MTGLSSLHLCTSDSWGGLESYACTLMDELRRTGCEVAAICKPKSKVESFLRGHSIRFTYLPSYATINLGSVRFMRSLFQNHNIDVVHAHFHKDVWPASLALRADRSRKLFLSVYMGVPKKRDIVHRYIYSRVDGFFTSSQELHERLPELYRVPPAKVHLLPYGRRLEHYRRDERKRDEIRARCGIQQRDIVVGTMIRIDPGKGVMDFARSFLYIAEALRENVRFMIVGEPTRKGHRKPQESPFEPRCEAYLQELQKFVVDNGLSDRILLTGFQSDLVGYLSAFDIFVFPSRDELYSLVVLDAMSMSLPIVAARAGGNLHQIADGVNGLLYEVASSHDLARKVEIYLRDRDLRQQHGEGGLSFVRERHNMEETVRKLLAFYEGNPNLA